VSPLSPAHERFSTRPTHPDRIISGGLSTVAGAGFIAASGMPAAHLGNVAGYMALGAVFYLLWAYRSRTIATTGR